jgi:alanyl-tRNA synthetase
MLGNWSLGDYFKKDSITYSFEFLTKILKIPSEEISVTCFAGDKNSEKDKESSQVWTDLGIPKSRIKFLGKENNWWPTEDKQGPCGPDTEIFINQVEIWNNVFMQYNFDGKEYQELPNKNVDTGMGVERTLAILNNLEDNYLTECFYPIIQEIEKISKIEYNQDEKSTRSMRIIADHLKASVFILAEGIIPSNSQHGYVLRRLIRTSLRHLRLLGVDLLKDDFTIKIAKRIIKIYPDYPELSKNSEKIFQELKKEEDKFQRTLDNGLKIFEKMSQDKIIDGREAFLLYQSYGFPIEMIQELANEKKLKLDLQGFFEEQKKHKELSQTADKGKFKSGLADTSQDTVKLHTASHLLLEALNRVLKIEINQKGSNITPERLRFDFSFDRKLTEEEIQEIEDLVNKQISKKIKIEKKELSLKDAKSQGARGVFDSKYKENVSVYSIGDFSNEICAGPHVKNTQELGKFKIQKQESCGTGIRRMKAVLE